MSQKKRERTAQYHLTVIDRIALDVADKATTQAVRRREIIEDGNFHQLVAQGVIVEERTENGTDDIKNAKNS